MSTERVEWAIFAYDAEERADGIEDCADETDARIMLREYQRRPLRFRDPHIVRRTVQTSPWERAPAEPAAPTHVTESDDVKES